ncbi:MAG: fimbrillin family protein [Muribaculaceae bacterium]|nr:fimbrillin family protein [Muribaculaceae bacterium]
MKKLILIPLIALFGCNADDKFADAPADGTAIEVSTYIQASRAIDKTTFANGDVMMLNACRTTGEYADAFTPNFMDKVQVTYSDGSWTYSPLMAWPTDNNEHISFTAFYPSSTEATPLTYKFTVADNADEQTDPLWCTVRDASISDRNGKYICGNADDAAFEPASGAMTLKFRHMLSKVNFYIKLDADYPGTEVKLNSLTLHNVNSQGTFTIANDLSTGTWASSHMKDYTLFETGENLVVTQIPSTIAETILIPQTMYSITGTKNKNSYLTLCYSYPSAEGGEITITKEIFLTNEWVVNKIYNYTINLSIDINTISISTVVVDWDSSESNPNHNLSTTPAEPIDLGLSVKWSSYDYGASNPYEKGHTYQIEDITNFDYDNSWGGNWSSPTKSEWEELLNKCTIEKTNENGITGYRVHGPNGNSIFLINNCYGVQTILRSNMWYYYHIDLESNEIINIYYDSATYPVRPVYK